ncbi:MAG: PrsW family intramembrane metalloprotease [Verrucomicrobiae bacterium]|nr:PrsW family intramembrane metalloprotease [Verrucomicrobiae bacterium]
MSQPTGNAPVTIFKAGVEDMVLTLVEKSLRKNSLKTEELLGEIPYLCFWLVENGRARLDLLFQEFLSREDADIASLFLEAMSRKPEEAKEALESMAGEKPPVRYSNQILGLLAKNEKKEQEAYEYFLKEGEIPEAVWSRKQAVLNRFEAQDFETLEKLATNPAFQDAIPADIQTELALSREDWLNALKWVAIDQFSHLKTGIFILATLGMVIWVVILLQLCQVDRLDKWTPLLCLLGLLLGMASTTPTLLWGMLEDRYLPISAGDDFFHNLVYYIATVGVREEVCKLVLFLPLAPILIKRGNELEYLLVASLVGLGFAYEENFTYLSSSMGTGIAGRFLSANFFHISLTGMCGLFLCRAFGRHRAYGFNEFLYIFGIAIVAHGVYDAFLIHPPFQDGGILAMILFVLFSKYYFQEARALRDVSHYIISLSGTIVFGMSLLLAALLVYLSSLIGLNQAVQLAVGSFLSSAIILFMFFREFNESLSA